MLFNWFNSLGVRRKMIISNLLIIINIPSIFSKFFSFFYFLHFTGNILILLVGNGMINPIFGNIRIISIHQASTIKMQLFILMI